MWEREAKTSWRFWDGIAHKGLALGVEGMADAEQCRAVVSTGRKTAWHDVKNRGAKTLQVESLLGHLRMKSLINCLSSLSIVSQLQNRDNNTSCILR